MLNLIACVCMYIRQENSYYTWFTTIIISNIYIRMKVLGKARVRGVVS